MLLARHVEGDRGPGDHLRLRRERGQIRRDLLPDLPTVGRHVHELGTVIDLVRVVRRHVDRHDALEPVLQVLRIVAVQVCEADVVLLLLAGATVVQPEAALAVGVDDVRIAGLRHGGTGLAATMGFPRGLESAGLGPLRTAGYGDGRVVLLTGVEAVREVVRDVDLVQLGRRLVVL